MFSPSVFSASHFRKSSGKTNRQASDPNVNHAYEDSISAVPTHGQPNKELTDNCEYEDMTTFDMTSSSTYQDIDMKTREEHSYQDLKSSSESKEYEI